MSSPVSSNVETLDVLTAVIVVVASLCSVVYIWLPRSDKLFWPRLFSEVLLELAFLVLLAFAVTSFSDETVNQRRRIKTAVAIMYVTAAYQIAAFGVVVVLSFKRGTDDVWVHHVNRRASKSSWVLFLAASFGLFVAYVTINASNGQSSAADSLVLGLVYPSLISVAVLGVHVVMAFVNCCRTGRRVFSWHDTSGYHPLVHKVLTTIFAAFAIIFPLSLAVSGGVDTVSDETSSAKDSALFLIDVLAAMLHRHNLHEFTMDRREMEKKLIKDDEEAAKDALSPPTSPKPGASSIISDASGAVSSAVEVSRGLPPGAAHQAQHAPFRSGPGSIARPDDHSVASGPGTHSGAASGVTSVVPQQHPAYGVAAPFAGGSGYDSYPQDAPSGAPGYAHERQPRGYAPVGHGLPGVPIGPPPPPPSVAPGPRSLPPPPGAPSSHLPSAATPSGAPSSYSSPTPPGAPSSHPPPPATSPGAPSSFSPPPPPGGPCSQ